MGQYYMKAKNIEMIGSNENAAGPGGPPLEGMGESGVVTASRRWELAPILWQGEQVGWRAVRNAEMLKC